MEKRTRTRVVALVAALGAIGAAAVAPSASATGYGNGGPKVTVLASGLSNPFGLQRVWNEGFVVAENDAGQVTWVDRHGKKRPVITGATGVSGVAAGYGKVFAVLGGGDETGPPPVGPYAPTSVLRSDWSGKHVKPIANLLDYELKRNPDGQKQFDADHKPYDTLSNPFSMNLSRYGLLVADGGGNSVIRINPWTGKPSTFFVPPTVKDVKACLAPGQQLNPGTVGCDPVPTGIAVARGSVYVSTLGAEVPGAGRVYRVNPWNGKILQTWKGLTAPTGIAVSPNGTIYVSEVLEGAPEGDGPPPDGFDPADVGQITKISHGKVTHAQVTMPTGLQYRHGHLYSTAWSIASFLGIPNAGQVVKVSPHAFK